jgi:hypothetical protein
MKITKQRLRELIREELKEAYSREEVSKIINVPKSDGAPSDSSIPMSELLVAITSISDLVDELQQKIQMAAHRNLRQHPGVEEAITTLQEAKTFLASIKI